MEATYEDKDWENRYTRIMSGLQPLPPFSRPSVRARSAAGAGPRLGNAVLCLLALLLAPGECRARTPGPVRIAYFHGGKSYLLYRTYASGFFERENVRVALQSEFMGRPGFRTVPKSYPEFQKLKHGDDGNTYFGKLSGTLVAEAIARGEFDGGTMGESSFLRAASRGIPIAAVAMLAHDTREAPAKAILLLKGLHIRRPADLRGKTLISRRGGPGESAMLREFLDSVGLKAGKDLKVIDQVEENRAESLITEGKVDGGLYHVSTISRLLKTGKVRVYRRMDWMDPAVSHGLLVFRKDFLESRPSEVEAILRAYVKRIRYEKNSPDEASPGKKRSGPRRHLRIEGMDLPQTDDPPLPRPELLDEA